MSSGGHQAADGGARIRAGAYSSRPSTTSSASALSSDANGPVELGPRAERVLVAVPAGGHVTLDEQAESPKSASRINRRLTRLGSIDLAASTVAAMLASWLDSGAPPWAVLVREPSVLALPAAWLCLIAVNGGYDARGTGACREEGARVFRAFVHFAVLVAVVSYATHAYFAREFLLIALPLALAFTLAGRATARAWQRGRRVREHGVGAVLAVGDALAVSAFAEAVLHERSAGIVVRGACLLDRYADDPEPLAAAGVPVVGDIGAVVESARAIGAETIVIVSASQLGSDRLRWLAWQLEGTGIQLLVSANLQEVARRRLHIHSVAWMPLLHVEQPEFRGLRLVVKEGMDRLIALIAAITLLPLFAVIVVVVRMSSSGPAIFRQTRVGRGGRTFEMLKFRSMFVDAEARLADLQSENVHAAGPLFKLHRDPRVTRIGRILRRYSLDELPQLWNVLAGQMSLVGPRPPLPSEVSQYESDARRRLLVKPGMTGLWQVSGRSDLSWAESVRLDLRYVENWSPALDLMILLKTASAVLRGSGAY